MSLSDKIIRSAETALTTKLKEPITIGDYLLRYEDVREAVKEIKKEIKAIVIDLGYTENDYALTIDDINGVINEVVGEKLI